MKGKNTFTAKEISDLKQLIWMRVNADKDGQKKIRRIMRSIGFYGSDYGIVDFQVSDLEGLIRSGVIKVVGGKPVSAISLRFIPGDLLTVEKHIAYTRTLHRCKSPWGHE